MQHPDGSLSIADRHGRPLASVHIPQGDTNDCGPHVVTMAVNFWHGEDRLDAHTTAQAMNRPRWGAGIPPLVVRRIPKWATFPWGIADMLRQHGIPARWRLWASEDDLLRALREDRLAMPIYGQPLRRRGWRYTGWSHVVILAGWTPATGTFQFIDSSQHTAPTGIPRDTFLRQWSQMGRLLIESRA